jgi:hypothetical protein
VVPLPIDQYNTQAQPI